MLSNSLEFPSKSKHCKKEMVSQIYGCRTLLDICDGAFKVKNKITKTYSIVHGFYNNTLYCYINNSVYEMQKQPFADVLRNRCS